MNTNGLTKIHTVVEIVKFSAMYDVNKDLILQLKLKKKLSLILTAGHRVF